MRLAIRPRPGAGANRYGIEFIDLTFLPAGPHALLVEVDDLDAVGALHAEIGRRRAAGWAPSLVDVVPAARTILLDGVDDPAGMVRDLRWWAVPPVAP
jgi:hypothetical protein